MTDDSVEHFVDELAPLLKQHGFGKQRLNWRKDLGPSFAVVNVQISAWGDRSYCVNVGIYLKSLGAERKPAHNRCHVQQRLAVSSPPEVVASALAWFAQRQDNAALAALHKSGALLGKGLVFKEVVDAIRSGEERER